MQTYETIIFGWDKKSITEKIKYFFLLYLGNFQ